MAKSSKKVNSTELRKFGMLMAAVLTCIGIIVSFNGRTVWPVVLPFSMVFFMLGLFRPVALSGVYRCWMRFADLSGYIMTAFILLSFFFLVVTPVGIVGRLFGKKFLPGGPDMSLDTYWTERQTTDRSVKGLERQF